MENEDELVFLVSKDIWLATARPQDGHIIGSVIGWTETKPQYDNGYIEKGSILTFDHLFKSAFVFAITTGIIEDSEEKGSKDRAEFLEEELRNLTKSGTLALLEIDEQWSEILKISKGGTVIPTPVSSTSVPPVPNDDYYPVTKEEFATFADLTVSKYINESILPTCDYIIDKRDTIEFPFAVDYKNEWSIWEGIREIIQNSMDTETRVDIYTPNNNTIVIHDEGKGLSIKDFRLGGGEKAKLKESKEYIIECNPGKLIRGAHGEGMKLTFLVLSKNPEIYKFYHYSRCIRATAEFVKSQRFQELTLDVYLDPIQPHKGTTFILNAPSKTIQELMNYCKTRFIYNNLYINGEKSTHTSYDMLSIKDANQDRTIRRTIGHIVDMHSYDPTKDIDKPLYVRGIYVRDMRTVFSYDFICPYLDSARNIVDISQIKDQIKRIYTNLEFQGISAKTVAERFVQAIYIGKDIDFIENSVYFPSYEVRVYAQRVYKEVWDDIFGKNAFMETEPTLTQLAMEQIYVERDENDNIINEIHYKPIKLNTLLERIFFSAGVQKDSDIIVQQTIDIPCPAEDLERNRHYLMKNLRDAISVLCPIYDLNPEEEIKKWDVFLVEYKTENQPPKNLWKNWDDISQDMKEEIFNEIRLLYFQFHPYPIIIEKGLRLPIIDLDYFSTIANVSNLDKKTIISQHPEVAKYIEKFENRILPVRQKLGYYNHTMERFGIRYDCIVERDKTFTVVIHEYAHKEKEVDDIDDYDSAMGKILNVIQTGYGTILNDSLLYADQIYGHYILKTIFENISASDMPDGTREYLLESLKTLPDNISDVVFAACRDKKNDRYRLRDMPKTIKDIYLDQVEQPTPPTEDDFVKVGKILAEEDMEIERQAKEEWESTAYLHGEEYISTGGTVREDESLDYMLKYYNFDARNKTLIENIEFNIHEDYKSIIPKDVHAVKIEYLTEPVVTNVIKQYYPDSETYRYYNIAHLSSGDIVVFTLRDDGKYPNVPRYIDLFVKKVNKSKAIEEFENKNISYTTNIQ